MQNNSPIDTIDIVAIGVSTGGPNALHYVIPKLPGNIGVPIIIVQHMPSFFTLQMAKALDEDSKLTVVEGKSGVFIEPDIVYVAPGNRQMRLFRHPQTRKVALIITPMIPWKIIVDRPQITCFVLFLIYIRGRRSV